MEEVEGYLSGERDYTKIQGCTGPLVYPAGFLYIFSFLRSITDEGVNIFKAQYIFVGIYLLQQLLTFICYQRSSKCDVMDMEMYKEKISVRKQGIPAVYCILLLLSKRVHSIYMLRMFNDCIAVLLGYIALVIFTSSLALSKKGTKSKGNTNMFVWIVGSIFYSLAVSVKMNMLLFAPGLTLVYLMNIGLVNTIICIGCCGVVQLVVGVEFLKTYPLSYITKAFELGRVFTFKWSVNFQFLSEEVFVSKQLSILLLVLTALAYLMFAHRWISQVIKHVIDLCSLHHFISICA